ncbi:MAG TPA: hypothetical protein VFZ00_20525 [Solirubrobacter sp.]|nr:hypothetical protein [Solirubrobacter sp.]
MNHRKHIKRAAAHLDRAQAELDDAAREYAKAAAKAPRVIPVDRFEMRRDSDDTIHSLKWLVDFAVKFGETAREVREWQSLAKHLGGGR